MARAGALFACLARLPLTVRFAILIMPLAGDVMGSSRFEDSPDEMIVEEFRSTGDNACFAELFRRHRSAIYRCCMVFSRNPATAEDLTQETFTAALLRIDRFTAGSFNAWLRTIARNLCINHVRCSTSLREVSSAEQPERPASSKGDELAAEVLALLDELPQRQRICLKLFHIEGYSYKEICRFTNYTAKEVKTHIQNGNRRFRLTWESLNQVRKANV